VRVALHTFTKPGLQVCCKLLRAIISDSICVECLHVWSVFFISAAYRYGISRLLSVGTNFHIGLTSIVISTLHRIWKDN